MNWGFSGIVFLAITYNKNGEMITQGKLQKHGFHSAAIGGGLVLVLCLGYNSATREITLSYCITSTI